MAGVTASVPGVSASVAGAGAATEAFDLILFTDGVDDVGEE